MPQKPPVPAPARHLSAGLAAWLIIGGLAAWAAGAGAQDTPSLRNLVFEPVAIRMESAAPADPAGDNAPVITELTSLPDSGDPVTLQSLFRRGTAGGDVPLTDAAIEGYERSVRELELAGGVYEERLAQELLDLGNAYQRRGEHGRAIEVFERASHINRVNLGLFNLQQQPIVRETIESQLAAGNLQAADRLQEYLFYIRQKTHGAASPELVPALNELAEWNLFTFNAGLRSGAPFRHFNVDGKTFHAINFTIPPENEGYRARRLVNAQNLYRAAIQVLRDNGGRGSDTLQELEHKLAQTNYYFASNYNYSLAMGDLQPTTDSFVLQNTRPIYDNALFFGDSLGYRQGRDALERRLDYLRDRPDSGALQLARAHVELGDWYLLFQKRVSAIRSYEQAWQVLQQARPPLDDARQSLLRPPVPVSLPTFIAPRHSRQAHDIPPDTALRYRGYIDISFMLNRYGLARDVEVLGKTPNATEEVEDRLLRQIRRAQYRPRFLDGAAEDGAPVTLRYYFIY